MSLISRREAIAAGLLLGGWVASGAKSEAAGAAEPPLVAKAIPVSGEKLPVIGIGTNAFSARAPEEIAARRAVLRRLAELGGKVIDTARIYGESEAVIGDALADLGLRERMFLVTKVMARDRADGEASIAESFRLLRTPRIDLLMVHNLLDMEELVPLLADMKQRGQIRYLGITTSQPGAHARMAQAMRSFPLDFIEVDYSLADREAEQQVLPLAIERRIAVLANVPFGGRRGPRMFERVAGRPLPDWANEIDATSWAQLFLKYVVSHPAVTCAIPGTTEVSHLTDNLRGGRGRLADPALRARMESLWQTLA